MRRLPFWRCGGADGRALAATFDEHPAQLPAFAAFSPIRGGRAHCIGSGAMVSSQAQSGEASDPCRLNLLLTSGGWRHEPWVESLPALMAPMGVRTWRAGTGREAADLIREIPIHIAVVDLALPLAEATQQPVTDEGGARLLQLLGRLKTPPPTIVVQRVGRSRDCAREMSEALNLGVFAVMRRPVEMELLLDTFRRVLRRHYKDRWPDGVF